MGSRIATNLLGAQYPVTVWNRSTQPVEALSSLGATVAHTPKQAAEETDVVISIVTDDDASKAVWAAPDTGAIFGLTADKIAIEMSTLTASWAEELAHTISQQGSKFLAAPVVGSRPQAEAQKLISLVGGDASTLEKVSAILASSSAAIHYIGSVPQAMTMKLAVNALFGIQVAAIAELLGLLKQQGIIPTAAMDCLSQLPVTSPAAKGAGTLMTAENHTPMFPIHLVEKDFRYACAGGINTPTTTAIRQIFQAAIAQGYGNENITAIAHLFL